MVNLSNPDGIFEELKSSLLIIDPVHFTESYLSLEGSPLKLTGNGWKWMADIYRYISTTAMSPNGKPVVFVKGRQVGATIGAAALSLYMVASGIFGKGDFPPIRVMHAFPYLELMHAYSKDKLEKMIRESKEIQDFNNVRHPGKLTPFIVAQKDSAREATDSLMYKQFKNGNVLWCESIGNEGSRVRGRTVDVVFFDEVQDMSRQAISVATKVLTHAHYGTSPGGVQVYFGTPKQRGSNFHSMWEASDQRRYYLGCESCGEHFLLYTPGSDKWEKEIWLYENIVKCPSCGTEQDKIEAIERGKWMPTPGRENSQYVGFHFNQLLIPHFTKEVILKEKPENNPLASEVEWNNEVLGEFHSGEGFPITKDEIYKMCRDPARTVSKSIGPGEKMVYMGVDWGGKPDLDHAKRGQSYSCVVIISVDHDDRYVIEYAAKLKKLDLQSKIEFIKDMYRLYNLRIAVGDIGFAEDISGELKREFGNKYLTARNASQVHGGVKYRADELEIVLDKDKWIGDTFSKFRTGNIRFPWGSYERVAWLVDHCVSMESKDVMRSGMPHRTYKKGRTQNDGLMALIYAIVAYKFEQTGGFKTSINKKKQSKQRALLAYAPGFI